MKRKLLKSPSRNLVQLTAQDATSSTPEIMDLTKSALIVVTQLARVALAITREDLAIAPIRTLVIHTVNVSRSGII